MSWVFQITCGTQISRMQFANMQKIDHSSCRFESGKRHDKIVRLILPYARNISAVSDNLEADAMRGQLTTETLGFSQI